MSYSIMSRETTLKTPPTLFSQSYLIPGIDDLDTTQ